MNYYNEFDPNAAAWLRQLIADGLIPPGVVDQRSITDVSPNDLSGFTQCHWFAGIGGWPLALALAGWPADRPVWTGSAPCQPFSVAGKGKGADDERHLWPELFRLISKRRPPVVFGEQVASLDAIGWLDGVFTNLEGDHYACGAVPLGAHSVGADHQRKRLYWVADSQGEQWNGSRDTRGGRGEFADGGDFRGLGNTPVQQFQRLRERGEVNGRTGETGGSSPGRGMGDPDSDGCSQGSDAASSAGHRHSPYSTNFWSDSRWIKCRDGKHRRIPTEPALFPLADGLPYKLARRGSIRPALLKGAGNAIVPQVAAAFITAFLDTNPTKP